MQNSLVDVHEYYSAEDFSRMKAFADTQETPFLVLNLSLVDQSYTGLQQTFPAAKVYYAVKANPAPEILELLRDRGSCFDLASVYELDRALSLGIPPERLSCGNTIKKRKDVRYFYEKGVRMFVTDSEGDLQNIAAEAPGSKVYVRLLTEGSHTADWPLSRKFGCHKELAIELLLQCKQLGLIPYGISFHVGSQQRDISAWEPAICKARLIFEELEVEHGIKLQMINMGGGFPANYITRTNELDIYGREISMFLENEFGDDMPEIILEPGRSLCANAGVLVSEIVLISRKSETSLHRWVYTDVGKFSGLIETMDEAIKYPIYCEKEGEREDCVLAGPSCDSADIMYEDYKYELPLSLETGDRLYWLTTGAYTVSYSAIEFNGFPPLKQYFIKTK